MNGFYQFYTLRPVSYRNSTNPEHIHPNIKEPGYNEYRIDEYLFADDPLLPQSEKDPNPRGGSGVVKVVIKDGVQRASRDIILGLNVPDYPEKGKK